MASNGDAPRPDSPTGSPRTASVSLQAAAAMNAGIQRETSRRQLPIYPWHLILMEMIGSSSSSIARNLSSPHAGRRRSTVLLNLQLNDPSMPAPGEMASEQGDFNRGGPQPLSGSPVMADPHHHRAPSLGELHQELEAEQEAHVVRTGVFHRPP